MKISFEESFVLSTYLELFNRCYNLEDKRKYNADPQILVRHIEMHNVIFLLQNLLQALGITSEYSFSWNLKGPYSPGLENLLNNIDKKETAVENFYEEYNSKRNNFYCNRKQQLQELLYYLEDFQIEKIVVASVTLENILKEEFGSEILAGMIYLEKNIFPHTDLSTIVAELNKRGYFPTPQLAETIWKDLEIIGIRDSEVKRVYQKSKDA